MNILHLIFRINVFMFVAFCISQSPVKPFADSPETSIFVTTLIVVVIGSLYEFIIRLAFAMVKNSATQAHNKND